jgi:sugar (pentulose or hexulose) kinase
VVLNVALNRLLGVALVQRALILGVDAGLTMTKAALFDEEGREVAAVSARSEISHPRPGWAERSMDEAWTSAARAIRNVFTVANANSENVAAVGLTGAMVGVWPIDAKGRPVRQAVLVSDTRGQEALRGSEKISEDTEAGLHTSPTNTDTFTIGRPPT